MTGTSTTGAEWQGGGEAKALGRIFGPTAVEDDADAAPPLKVPATAAVHQATQDEIDLAVQTQIAADALKEAEGVEHYRIRAGNELLKLRAIFLRVELGRDAVIERMRNEGYTYKEIGAAVGIDRTTTLQRYAAIKAKVPLGTNGAAVGKFVTWAANKFGKRRASIIVYMSLARKPERLERLRRQAVECRNRALRIGRAIEAAQKRPGVPEPLRRAFQALPVPARERWLVWAASLLIGSDDPQSIARWFAKRFTS